MAGASAAHKNEVEFVLGNLSEADCLVVLAPLAREVLPSRESGVLDAFRVHVQILSAQCEVRAVDAIVHLVAFLRPLTAVAELALILEVVAVVRLVLFGLEHVVALSAEAHAFKLSFSSHPVYNYLK